MDLLAYKVSKTLSYELIKSSTNSRTTKLLVYLQIIRGDKSSFGVNFLCEWQEKC